MRSAPYLPTRSSAAAPPCATSCLPMARQGISSRNCRCMAGRLNPADTARRRCVRCAWAAGPAATARAASIERHVTARGANIGATAQDPDVSQADDITVLLGRAREGDSHALEQLLPQVYNELRTLAHRYLMRENAGHTLSTTALVHEAYLR